MHKHIATIIFASLLCSVFDASSQQIPQPQQQIPQPQQQPSNDRQALPPSAQYLKETTTIPYETTRKTSRLRHKTIRKAIRALKKNNYSESVTGFRNVLKADSLYAKAQYDAAIAHAGLQQYDTALNYYQRVTENPSATLEQRSNSHYNAGNIHLRKALAVRDTGGYDPQSLQSAISEYKSALRLNPSNKDAQHNLSLAKQLLRPQSQDGSGGGGGQNQQNQNQEQQQNQDQQQNQNKDQQKQNQQNQDKQNQNSQNQDQQQQNQQNKQDRQKQEQSRREAEQMLNAMKNNEQQTMRAVRMKEAEKERRQGRPVRIEKDW